MFLNHLGGQKHQQALTSKHKITASLAMGIEFFLKGIPLLKPRIYQLGAIRRPPVVIYSDAEWTVVEDPPSIKKGLGGILWRPGELPHAAEVDTPQNLVDALSERKTQIIPLELMAAAGMLTTYGHMLRGEDVIFFIDNQSVCCALVKGCSRSWDIQLLSTCWQLLCLQLGCRVWIEWVPSESNPADILSRAGTTDEETFTGIVDTMLLPSWANVKLNKDIKKVFDSI
jgi:hypothetical protein